MSVLACCIVAILLRAPDLTRQQRERFSWLAVATGVLFLMTGKAG